MLRLDLIPDIRLYIHRIARAPVGPEPTNPKVQPIHQIFVFVTYTLKYLIFDHEIMVHFDAFLIIFCKPYNLGACLVTPPRRVPAPSLGFGVDFRYLLPEFSGSAVAGVCRVCERV